MRRTSPGEPDADDAGSMGGLVAIVEDHYGPLEEATFVNEIQVRAPQGKNLGSSSSFF